LRNASWNVRILTLGLLVCAFAASLAGAAESGAQKPTPIDLNKASEEQLMTVPGIGEAIAKRIVTFRDEHGPFRRVEDLMRVKGIGEKSLERIRPYVKVEKAG